MRRAMVEAVDIKVYRVLEYPIYPYLYLYPWSLGRGSQKLCAWILGESFCGVFGWALCCLHI